MKQSHTSLIENLTDELTPVTPLKKPIYRTIIFLAICGVYLTLLIALLGLRYDIEEQMGNAFYILEISLVFIGAIFSAFVAFELNIPQGVKKNHLKYLAILPTILLMIFLIAKFFYPSELSGGMVKTNMNSYECFIDIVAFTIFPIIVALFSLRKGATTSAHWSGILIALSAANFSYIVLRLIEANDDAAHIISWHYSPMLVLVLICVFVGNRVLKW